ncbi:hypothetical protein HAX54_020950 [Datura stramonium]|uniref:Uncharacterized protein n=1 Tax=Datura stramonium TaxID=4076 RepID=A0ABS8UTU1_DATST|nr:hypothetical protein [Datura stramonium]
MGPPRFSRDPDEDVYELLVSFYQRVSFLSPSCIDDSTKQDEAGYEAYRGDDKTTRRSGASTALHPGVEITLVKVTTFSLVYLLIQHCRLQKVVIVCMTTRVKDRECDDYDELGHFVRDFTRHKHSGTQQGFSDSRPQGINTINVGEQSARGGSNIARGGAAKVIMGEYSIEGRFYNGPDS